MKPTLAKLKNINPKLVWKNDKEINNLICFLEDNGFKWLHGKKAFYNERIDFLLKVKEMDRFVDSIYPLKKKLAKKVKKPVDRKKEHLQNYKIATVFIKFFIFFVIVNLFLGWIFFILSVWIALQLFFVLGLILFIKIKIKIGKKIKK